MREWLVTFTDGTTTTQRAPTEARVRARLAPYLVLKPDLVIATVTLIEADA